MRRCFDRLRDERGSVGVLLSMVIFTVVGMLMMTFNTVQLSKEKMRLQNAADSAALEHALWQARSMNALQNLNDEGYVTAETATTFLNIAAGLEGAAKAAALVPFGKFIAFGLRIGVVMIGGMSSIMSNIVLRFAIPITSFFYARIAVPLGYLGAQQFAYANGATALLSSAKFLSGGFFGNLSFGFYAVGISPSSPLSTFRLPVEQREMKEHPYKCDNKAKKKVFEVSVARSLYKALHIGDDWDFKPWVSEGLYSEYDAWKAKQKAKEEQEEQDKQLEEMIQAHINTDTNRIIEAKAEIAALEQEIKELGEKMYTEYELQGKEIPPELEAEVESRKKKIESINQELTDAGLSLYDDVNDPEWQKKARARACAEYDITDPQKRSSSGGQSKAPEPNPAKAKLPGATVWVAMKAKNSIMTLPLAGWSKTYAGKGIDDSPVIAIAAAKCITGDLVAHNKPSKEGTVNQRPSGFGVGATAKLIPVERAMSEIENKVLKTALSTLTGLAIYH